MKISKNRSAYADFRYLCRGAERLCDRDINGNSKSTLTQGLVIPERNGQSTRPRGGCRS